MRTTLILCLIALLTACADESGPSQDRSAPVVTLIGDNPQIVEAGSDYTELGATANDNRDGNLTGSLAIDASQVDTSVPGSYDVSYIVSDSAGNTGSVIRTVSVVDTTPPVVSILGDDPQMVSAGDPYIEFGATASDSIDGDLSAAIEIDSSSVDVMAVGEYTVTYSVTDAAGNVGTATRTVSVADTTPPVISLLGEDPQIVIAGSPYVELGAVASDDLDGDLSAAIAIDSSAVNTGAVGDYTVNYNVSDEAGNPAAAVIRVIQVRNPSGPEVSVSGDIRKLVFGWTASDGAEFYRLLENPDGHSGFSQLGDDIPAAVLSAERDISVHQFNWTEAQYIVEACTSIGCNSSDVVTVFDVMLDTIGYFKASNPDPSDLFGGAVSLSADGRTLAVGAWREDSAAAGVNGDQSDNLKENSGAVYVFRFDGEAWFQQAYLKVADTYDSEAFGAAVSLSADGNTLAVNDYNDARGAVHVFQYDGTAWQQQARLQGSNTEFLDIFGYSRSISLSGDGRTLAVGASLEDSSATGVNGDQSDNATLSSGAVYMFRREGNSWYQQAYIKASNTGIGDEFGISVALSNDGKTLVVGAKGERSGATGVNGDQSDNSTDDAGAAYLFRFDGVTWQQEAYLKASNTDLRGFGFGWPVEISGDGNTVAVAAPLERSASTGINGDQYDLTSERTGAVYLFRFDGSGWFQQAYIKASNTGNGGWFGHSIALSDDGNRLAVGAHLENSDAMGINGEQDNRSSRKSGAVYFFRYASASWQQSAYIKPSNTGEDLSFGTSLSLSADGDTLAVGAPGEQSEAAGIGGDQQDDSAPGAGATYVY